MPVEFLFPPTGIPHFSPGSGCEWATKTHNPQEYFHRQANWEICVDTFHALPTQHHYAPLLPAFPTQETHSSCPPPSHTPSCWQEMLPILSAKPKSLPPNIVTQNQGSPGRHSSSTPPNVDDLINSLVSIITSTSTLVSTQNSILFLVGDFTLLTAQPVCVCGYPLLHKTATLNKWRLMSYNIPNILCNTLHGKRSLMFRGTSRVMLIGWNL